MEPRKSSVAPTEFLLVVAADTELKAILRGLGSPLPLPGPWTLTRALHGVDVVLTGVGKANAAGGAARTLDPSRHAGVASIGIGGSMDRSIPIGGSVLASTSVFADEGVLTPRGFTDCAATGFPPLSTGMGAPSDATLFGRVRSLATRDGAVACVSTCSGTDELAAEVQRRTGAIAEAMEGAAVGLVAQRLRVPFIEFRTISNFTGDRERQQWNLPLALDALAAVIGPLVAAIRTGGHD